MKTQKKFNLGEITLTYGLNEFDTSLNLKRPLTFRECSHILRKLLAINIVSREDCYNQDEWEETKLDIADRVNDWLNGRLDDEGIADLAYDCSDEQLGLKNMIPILAYLKQLDVI